MVGRIAVIFIYFLSADVNPKMEITDTRKQAEKIVKVKKLIGFGSPSTEQMINTLCWIFKNSFSYARYDCSVIQLSE